MHYRIPMLCLFLFFMASTSLQAQRALTLSDAIRIGLHNSFQIKIAGLRSDISQQQADVQRNFNLPTIDFRLKQDNGFSFDSSPTSFVDGSYSEASISANVDASWVLFDGFTARLTKFQLEQLQQQSEGQEQLVVENTIHAIMLAYYNALIEQEKLNVVTEVQQLSAEKLDWAKEMKRQGSISAFDLLNYENALLADSVNLQFQQISTERALQQLKLAMGSNKKRKYQLTDPLRFEKKEYHYPKLVKRMVNNNQDLKTQLINLLLRDNQIKQQRASRKPSIVARSGFAHELSTSKFKSEERQQGAVFDFYINFSLSYRLFDGGEARRGLQTAQVEKHIASLEIEELRQQLKNELELACYNYHNQAQIINTQEKLVQNLRKGLRIGKDRLENGYSGFLDYRSLQLDFLRSQLDLLEATYQILVIDTDIIRLTGGLTKRKK